MQESKTPASMSKLSEKTGIYWIPVIIGIYLLHKSLSLLLYPLPFVLPFSTGYALESDMYPVNLTISYTAMSVIWPLLFTLICVEVGKRRLQSWFFYLVISSHFVSVAFATFLALGLKPEWFQPWQDQTAPALLLLSLTLVCSAGSVYIWVRKLSVFR